MFRQSSYVFASKLVGYALRIAVPVLLVRALPMADFGRYKQFFLLQTLAATVLQLGMIQALYYFVPREREHASSFFVNSVLFNVTLVSAAFLGLAPWRDSIAHFLNTDVFSDYYLSLGAYTLVMMLVLTCDAYYLASGKVQVSAFFEISGQLITSILTVGAAILTHDLGVIVTAIIVGRVVHLLASLGFIQLRYRAFSSLKLFHGLRPQLRYSIVLGLAGMINSFILRQHQLFAVHYTNPADFAIYAAGCTDLPVLSLFAQSLVVVALRDFAIRAKKEDYEGIAAAWRRMLAGLYALGIPFILLLFVGAPFLIRLLFTSTYLAAVPIFRAATLMKIGLLYNAPVVLRAQDRTRVILINNLFVLVSEALAMVAGYNLWGMVGIIGVHAAFLTVSRIVLVAIANRRLAVPLAYVPSVTDVAEFYRGAFHASRAFIARIRQR